MYEFLSEEDMFDYIDAMHTDGEYHEALIEDNLTSEFTLAHEIAEGLEQTFGEIINLPEAPLFA